MLAPPIGLWLAGPVVRRLDRPPSGDRYCFWRIDLLALCVGKASARRADGPQRWSERMIENAEAAARSP